MFACALKLFIYSGEELNKKKKEGNNKRKEKEGKQGWMKESGKRESRREKDCKSRLYYWMNMITWNKDVNKEKNKAGVGWKEQRKRREEEGSVEM